jgi:tetratricopeptide (TPR) repeat protein
MVMALPEKDTSASSDAKESTSDRFETDDKRKRKVRKKYQRKRIPETERERRRLSQERQEKYEQIVSNANGEGPSVWSFEGLFPKAVWDEKSIERDLYEIKRRDIKMEQSKQPAKKTPRSKMKTSAIGASSMMRVWRDPKLSSFILPYDPPRIPEESEDTKDVMTEEEAASMVFEPTVPGSKSVNASISERLAAETVKTNSSGAIDYELTRMVEDKIYGYRRGTGGQSLYDSSMLEDGAVKFRDGVRLGNPLPVNAARLNYHAKKELRNNRVEEAQELYETAIRIDPRDGRAYMGLSRCAERRRDFKLAREFLNFGIANTVSSAPDGTPDTGANPFLLQALGCLEEKCGHLAEAEALYIEAAKSRPSHAASWVALAQLRTRKFRQSAAAGRACYQAAERELHKAGMPPSSHVYTAWASLEYKKGGDMRRSRNLYKEALKVDKRCSAAWLQLGVMEADCEHWREAELCFETVMKFDQRNSRVLQAYAIMESKRPDSNSRKVIGLFERALRVNSRDAGVLQPYALYVAELGDIESARDL